MSEPTYELVLPLLSDDPAYAHGFEAGCLWERLKQGPGELEATVHAENLPQCREMAHRTGYRLETETAEDGWVFAAFRGLE